YYIKGLDLLVESVNIIKEYLILNNAKITLYGPDIDNSKKKLNEMISEYGLNTIINIKEPVFSEEKYRIMSQSDFFIQTSRTEGLPMGILEALSFGLPCIITPGTNLSKEVAECEAGVEV